MSRALPAIVLLDLSANVLVVVMVLLIAALAKPAARTEPLSVPILVDAPTGAAALVDALFARTQAPGRRVAVDLTRDGVRVTGREGTVDLAPGGPRFASTLVGAVGGPDAEVDLFVFDARHHTEVRSALGARATVREVTVPPSLRAPDEGQWSRPFAQLFGRAMTAGEFRGRLARLLAGEGTAVAPPDGQPPSRPGPDFSTVERLALPWRVVLLLVSLAAFWRVPDLSRRATVQQKDR